MLKRIISVFLCAAFALAVLPEGAAEINITAQAKEGFGDRILYGGLAVDIGDDTIMNENGNMFLITAEGEKTFLAEIDAKYLNYSNGRLYYTAENAICVSDADFSNREIIKAFEGDEVKCLYAVENGFFYLRGESVYSLCDGAETVVLTREGIKGFVPNPDGTIRWIADNPNYTPVDQSGDEVWQEGTAEYLEYIALPGTDGEFDTAAGSGEAGTELASANGEYTGPVVQVGETTLPLAEHMPGTFFSKNGQACVCHNTSSTYCIQSVGNCNCMRYYPTGYANSCEIDLLGAQCFAFARMIFWTCFGFIDHSMNASLYYSAGSLASGAVTANSVKNLLMKAAPGAHVRLAAGHSVSILTMDEDFIVIYHGNAGGDGVVSQPCVVSTRRYTWEQFATAAARGILYVNMPYNYPDSEVILSKKEPGYYRLKANLNLRAETNTASESLAVIPNGTIIGVTEIDGFWGKTEYNGISGWVFLEYTVYYTRETISPSGNTFVMGEDKYLRAAVWRLSFDSFSEHFDKQNLTVYSPEGDEMTATGYIGTGCRVELTVNGNIVDTATVCLAGDVNCNGLADVGDYIMIKRSCMGTYSMNEVQSAASDITGNGKVDSYDYILLRRYFMTENQAIFADFGKVNIEE